MEVVKTTVRKFDVYDCVKWGTTVGDTLSFRDEHGIKNRGLDKCFICGYKFPPDEFPYLGLIKNHANQFICRNCAEKVNPERIIIEELLEEKHG